MPVDFADAESAFERCVAAINKVKSVSDAVAKSFGCGSELQVITADQETPTGRRIGIHSDRASPQVEEILFLLFPPGCVRPLVGRGDTLGLCSQQSIPTGRRKSGDSNGDNRQPCAHTLQSKLMLQSSTVISGAAKLGFEQGCACKLQSLSVGNDAAQSCRLGRLCCHACGRRCIPNAPQVPHCGSS